MPDKNEFTGKTEHKQFAFELKAISEDGSFKGYAARYDSVDLGGDKIEPFAASKSLKKRGGKMPILRNHSARMEDLVGENSVAVEDEKGFMVEGKFNLDTESGLDTYKKVKFAKENGRQTGLSIGYIANRKQIDYVDGVRILKEIDIMEYSVVVFPMQPTARISSVKSFCENASDEDIALKKREIETVLRDADCSREESKAAVSAIFAVRDALDDDKKEAEALEQKQAEEVAFVQLLRETAKRIRGDI